MSGISTHILDTALGKPAAGVAVRLDRLYEGHLSRVAESLTDADGRCRDLCACADAGVYRLTFAVGEYFRAQRRVSIYPEIVLLLRTDGESHYHLPLLLSDNSYTTYRGS